MKKILGLDLGSTSIGFALIEENEEKREIITMGSRIIPLSVDDKNQFSQGNAITKNQDRTTKRSQRKGYDRYQQRRTNLSKVLGSLDMLPDEILWKLPSLELYGLRNKAVSEKILLMELGRIFLHLNQKRGYKSIGKEDSADKKDTEYVAEVKGRHQTIRDLKLTIGQFFYNKLKEDFKKNEANGKGFITYRIKEQIFPREAYIEEFEAIWKEQSKYYSNILTAELKEEIKDGIIFYQRPLKSQKGLVSVCDFEGFILKKAKDGKEKEYFVGPKVAPKTSPLFQVTKIWETINTITLKSKKGEIYIISPEKKTEIFEYLNNNEKLSQTDLLKILKLNKEDYYGNKHIGKGLQGNLTKVAIAKVLGENHPLLNFNLKIEESDREVYLIDRKTGEVIGENNFKIISSVIEKETLYDLWHTMYSIKNVEECKKALIKKFSLEEIQASELAKIDLNKQAYGNKSNKAMRKILPYLMLGFVYSDAASFAGYNHSNSLTKNEKTERILKERLEQLPKNSLRQPVVEKILNQLVNVVNAIIEKYGKIDEIRVELARELKQSKEERNDAYKFTTLREKENKIIIERLQGYGIKATRNNIIKWRLFHEINNEESKLNATCIYCGKAFGLVDALKGNEVDVEHIIPKSLLFDDSQSNKTLSHRSCNTAKGNKTAFDYMSLKGDEELDSYLERVNSLFKKKIIGKAKRDKLLMAQNNIPQDFIERQLRETQYIARKAKEILEDVCNNVWSTSGNVTEYLRRIWGWDDVLMNLQFEKYRAVGQTKWVEWETDKGNQKHKKEVIDGWGKRDDHRHHAIDALVIACTKQGFIQRINKLSSEHTRKEMYAEIESQGVEFKEKLNLLDKYLIPQRPFNTIQVQSSAEKILISFKSGKKVATIGTRKVRKEERKIVVQEDVIIPRGSLHEDGVYGKINMNGSIEIVKRYKLGIGAQGFVFTGKETISSKEKIDKKTGVKIIVVDDKIESTLKDIVDGGIRIAILNRLNKGFEDGKSYKDDVKKALSNLKNIDNDPVWFNKDKGIAIKSVRMKTGLSAVESIITVDRNNKLQYEKYVKPGNNHHIALYKDKDGNLHEHVSTFWHAVERKKYRLPVVINNPTYVWDKINSQNGNFPQSFLEKLPKDGWSMYLNMQQNEMFILGMGDDDFDSAFQNNLKNELSKYLYRVQKMSIKGNGQIDLWFRHHLETELIDTKESSSSKRYYNIQSLGALEKLNPQKIRINVLGEIVF